MKPGLIRRLADYLSPYSEDCVASSDSRRITLVRNKGSGETAVLYNGFTYSRLPERGLFTRSYWDYLLPLGGISASPRLLMIGLGGGTIARQVESVFPGASMDIVEIDREMVGVARRLYPGMRSNVIVGDGLEFVKGARGAYDAVILDAYSDLDIPKAFTSEEFIGDAYRALKGRGVLGINYAQTSLRRSELHGYSGRLSVLFDVYHVRAGFMSDNTILVCGKGMSRDGIVALAGSIPKARASRHILEGYRNMVAFR